MRDQAQVELRCRAYPLFLWVGVIRINQGAPLSPGMYHIILEMIIVRDGQVVTFKCPAATCPFR